MHVATKRPRARRRGYTLVEAMIASLLLSVCVMGVSGSILASYAHDEQSKQQHDAARSAEALRDELTALPMTAASTSDVGLMDFNGYADTVAGDQNVVASASKASTKQTVAGTSGTPAASTSNAGLLGSVVGIVNGLLIGTTSSSNSGSGSNSSGSNSSGSSSSSSSGSTPGGSGSSSTSSSTVTTSNAAPELSSARSVGVDRRATLTGSSLSTGDLAIVTIDVTVGNMSIRVKRLVSSTEAAANTFAP